MAEEFAADRSSDRFRQSANTSSNGLLVSDKRT